MTFRPLLASVLALAMVVPAQAQQQGFESLLLPSPPQVEAPQSQQGQVAPQAVPQQIAGGGATEQAMRDAQFEQALRAAVPYSPDQIQDYRAAVDAAQRATMTPLSQGKPVSRSIRVSLSPGEQPPVARVQPGLVSTLTFSDVTGQPWPVLSVVNGNPSAYVAQSAGAPGSSNIIVLSAIQPHTPSNIAVTLVNHPVPVIISLQQGAAEVDYRLDVQVTSRGPNAQMDMVANTSLAPTNDSTMLAFLDGVPPSSAQPHRTSSSEVQAWTYGDMLYVRTSGDILSPAYVSRATNVSGTNVFVLHESPVVLISQNGRMTSVSINR